MISILLAAFLTAPADLPTAAEALARVEAKNDTGLLKRVSNAINTAVDNGLSGAQALLENASRVEIEAVRTILMNKGYTQTVRFMTDMYGPPRICISWARP